VIVTPMTRQLLDRLVAVEEVDEVDNQDDDDHQFKNEGAALVDWSIMKR
jgi:hypothetical protein